MGTNPKHTLLSERSQMKALLGDLLCYSVAKKTMETEGVSALPGKGGDKCRGFGLGMF